MSQKKNIKIWTASRNASAGMMVTEKKAFMVADRGNFVAVSPNGAVINGKSVVLNTTSENIRNGGLFVKMNDLTQMVPTTLVTPMPGQIPFPPLGFVTSIVKDLAFVMSLANPPSV